MNINNTIDIFSFYTADSLVFNLIFYNFIVYNLPQKLPQKRDWQWEFFNKIRLVYVKQKLAYAENEIPLNSW